MDFKTIIIVLVAASVAAFFIPTPQEMRTHFKSGQDYYASKDYKRAIEQYDWIINADSKFLEADSVRVALLGNELNVGVRTAAFYQKANALRNLGSKEESIDNYRIVERRPDSPSLSALAQFQIYEMSYADKDYKRAIQEARALIERYPLDDRVPRAWYDIAWAFRELSMIDSSNLAFETLVQSFPRSQLDARARYQLGQNLFDQGNWDEAVSAFTDLTDRYRPESFASTEWENVELKAVRDRRLFEAQAGRDVDANTLELVAKSQVRIGDAYQRKGQYENAIQTYRKVIATFALMPTLVEATYIKMAEYTAELKGIDEGIQIYRQAIDENFSNKPLQAKLQYKIARTYQEAKIFEKAAQEYLFYVWAYAPQANAIKFPLEQAYFLAISNFYNARNFQTTLSYADTASLLFRESELSTKIATYKGLASLGLGRFAQAREYFNSVVQEAPESNEALLARTQIGKSYFDERQCAKAVESFEQLLAGDRSKLDLSEVHYLLGLSYYGLDAHEKAIDHLSRVEPSSPYYPYTFARVTRAYVAQKRFDDVTSYLEEAFSSARSDSVDFRPFVRLARSELYTAQQKYDLAIAEFDSVVNDKTQTENTRVQALYGRGLVYFEMTKFKEASTDLQACLSSGVFQQVFPALVPQAKEKLAFSFITLEKKKEGAQLLTDLVAAALTGAQKTRQLATLCEFHYRSGEYAKAIEVGKRVLAMADKDEISTIRTYVAVSNSYGNLQQHEQAIATLKEAAEKFPANEYVEEVFYQLGLIYYNGGDFRSSAEAFRSHLQRFPDSRFKEDALYFYGFSQYQIGQADESIRTLREFIRTYPNSRRVPKAQLQIGEAYFNTTRFDEAAREYQMVYRQYPQDENAATAMFNEGWSYYQLEQNQKMLETFGNLVQKFPKSRFAADAQFTIGDYYYNQKSYDAALTAYQTFTSLFPDEPRVEEARLLIKDLSQVEAYREYEAAMAFFDAKSWKVAIAELTKVMDKYPNTDIVYGCKANIASAHEQLGERRKAIALFDEIIKDWKEIEAAKTAVFFAEMHKRWIEAGK
ncbi:MAG: tetratricopeptide repeat protein [Ignavibacteria bacterium]|nr:tetratricopeptide repeat protein [Ignavibacteria bacterium]